jgi:hypothetical protein
MKTLNLYYKISLDGSYCILESLQEAEDFMINEIQMLSELGECYDPSNYHIEEVFMTEEEFNNLPEFEGF